MIVAVTFWIVSASLIAQDQGDVSRQLASIKMSDSLADKSLRSRSDEFKFSTHLTPELFTELPKLSYSRGDLPISPLDAMSAAKSLVDKLVAADQFPNRYSVSALHSAPFDIKAGDWYWFVDIRGPFRAGAEIETIKLAVLMNGQVVKPTIQHRFDRGWPPADPGSVRLPEELTDEGVITEFVAELNPNRTHAGEHVRLRGQFRRMPEDDPRLFKTNHNLLFVTDGGLKLICNRIIGGPSMRLPRNVDLTITGRLVGFRRTKNHDESWDDLHLYPGIEVY